MSVCEIKAEGTVVLASDQSVRLFGLTYHVFLSSKNRLYSVQVLRQQIYDTTFIPVLGLTILTNMDDEY